MISKLVVSFLLLSNFLVRFAISEHVDRKNPIARDIDFQSIDPNAFVLVNPSQVHRLETGIGDFFSRIGKPISKPIVLRSAKEADVLSTIREICKNIRRSIIELFNDFGLINTTVQLYENRSREDPLSDDWYSEVLLQSVYTMLDFGNMINEITSLTDIFNKNGNATSRRNESLTSETASDGFHFLGSVNDILEFIGKLARCFLEMNTRNQKWSSSVIRTALNLMSHAPRQALRNIKSKVNDSLVKSDILRYRGPQKPWHVFLCLVIINDRIKYKDCIDEFRRFDECSTRSTTSEALSYDIDTRSWTKAIRCLSNCTAEEDENGEEEIFCTNARRTPKKVKRKVSYVFERILDRKISKGSPFHRAVNDLGDILSKSTWGQRFIDELFQCINIFEDGKEKLRKLSKFAGKDEKAATKHEEISRALKSYKKGALLRTFRTINKLHRSAIDFEKFFAQGMKETLKETWQSHVNVLTHLMDWMTKLLELYSGENGHEPSSSEKSTSQVEWNSYENSENMQEFATRSRTEMIKDADNSMNSLVESMNHLNRYRDVDNNNMLASTANNLLLIVIFIETLGFVSSLYALGQTPNEYASLEIEYRWNRERRSLFPSQYDQIIDFPSRDHLLFAYDKNSTLLFSDEND